MVKHIFPDILPPHGVTLEKELCNCSRVLRAKPVVVVLILLTLYSLTTSGLIPYSCSPFLHENYKSEIRQQKL